MSRITIVSALSLLLPACTGEVGALPKGEDTGGGAELGALEVDRIVPATGPASGGTSTTLTGAGFTDGVDVMVGSSPCAALTVVSSVEIACTTPAGAAGEYAVTVTRPEDGATASVSFTYEGEGGGTGGTGGDEGGGDEGGGTGGDEGGGTGGDEGGGTGGDEGGGTGGDEGGGTGGDEGGGTGGSSGTGTGGTTAPVDYCHLQYPCSMSGAAGTSSDATYVWVYQGGVTEGVGQGAGITVELGVGPDASNPASGGWTWSSASYNDDKDGLSPLANDEYGGTFTLPGTAGDYDYCGRVSADGGASWTYCDGGGIDCSGSGTDDGYSATDAGQLTVTP